jgi:mRNA-degrading endonuclease toxin of MazEF toxin-antitoxin module
MHYRFQDRSKRYFFNRNHCAAFVRDRTRGGSPGTTLALSAKDTRLPKDSRALCDQVRTIDKGRILGSAGVLTRELLGKIDRGLILHLELEGYVTA